MSYHYCTCTKDVKKVKLVEYGRTPYRLVTVSRDGICIDCGHYAVSISKKCDTKSGQLYYKLMGYKTHEEKLYNQREWKRKRKAGLA